MVAYPTDDIQIAGRGVIDAGPDYNQRERVVGTAVERDTPRRPARPFGLLEPVPHTGDPYANARYIDRVVEAAGVQGTLLRLSVGALLATRVQQLGANAAVHMSDELLEEARVFAASSPLSFVAPDRLPQSMFENVTRQNPPVRPKTITALREPAVITPFMWDSDDQRFVPTDVAVDDRLVAPERIVRLPFDTGLFPPENNGPSFDIAR